MDTTPTPRPAVRANEPPAFALLVAVLTCAAIAVPYWAAPAERVADDGVLGWFWMVAAALLVGTVVAGLVDRVRPWFLALAMAACLPVASAGRVVVDVAADPTSHSLWPMELVLAAVAGVPSVALGVGVVWLVRTVTAGGATRGGRR
ncbi:MAG: hypothetical protein U0R80_10375 [Nocardioidaceae bacterium]